MVPILTGTDDGSSGLLTKFVCKNANDLSEGTLYASKITQKGKSIYNHLHVISAYGHCKGDHSLFAYFTARKGTVRTVSYFNLILY
jgi:hypothetical protein